MFAAMVSGYAMNVIGEETLIIFSNMLEFCVKPDHVIAIAVLSASCHSDLVNEGLKIFNSIKRSMG